MNQNVFRIGFAIAAILVMALIAPIIWAAASAGLGLIALGAIGAVGFWAIQFLLYF